MITIQLFPSTFLFLFAVVFVVTIIVRAVRKTSKLKLFYVGIIELYVLLLFSVTILPIQIVDSVMLEEKIAFVNYFQLIPFYSIRALFKNHDFLSIQLVGNVILLMPLPILLGYINKKNSFMMLFAKCTAISLGIEIVQLCIDLVLQYPSRVFDVDDIILNAVGILLGILVFYLIFRFKKLYNWIGENIVWEI